MLHIYCFIALFFPIVLLLELGSIVISYFLCCKIVTVGGSNSCAVCMYGLLVLCQLLTRNVLLLHQIVILLSVINYKSQAPDFFGALIQNSKSELYDY